MIGHEQKYSFYLANKKPQKNVEQHTSENKNILLLYFFVHQAVLKRTFLFNMPLCENSAGYCLSIGSKIQFAAQKQRLGQFDLHVSVSVYQILRKGP